MTKDHTDDEHDTKNLASDGPDGYPTEDELTDEDRDVEDVPLFDNEWRDDETLMEHMCRVSEEMDDE